MGGCDVCVWVGGCGRVGGWEWEGGRVGVGVEGGGGGGGGGTGTPRVPPPLVLSGVRARGVAHVSRFGTDVPISGVPID